MLRGAEWPVLPSPKSNLRMHSITLPKSVLRLLAQLPTQALSAQPIAHAVSIAWCRGRTKAIRRTHSGTPRQALCRKGGGPHPFHVFVAPRDPETELV